MRKLLLPLLLVLSLLFTSAQAATTPWKWRLSLTGEESGLALNHPTALMVDEERKRYYVVDSGNNRLLSYDSTGVLIHVLKAGGQLALPYDLVRTSDGTLWVVEREKNSLTRINLKDRSVTPMQLLNQDIRIYPDRLEQKDDIFYVIDKMDGKLLQFNQELETIQTFASPDDTGAFIDFKITDKALWALDSQEKRIIQFTLDGTVTSMFSVAEIDSPTSLAIGPAGLIYVLDRHQGNIAVFHPNGHYKYRFLERGQARGQLYFPVEILFDPWGRLCVVEEGNGRVEIFER